ncbi:RDD family protein [Aliiroseovarius sp. KMU-50]|uniref:RDD family protein n=1 Tax=Aliiroseovarius salicola TaxID=3009082 RepID=A0ABT4VYG5_9RHOB|nr:RDD family protein [Aliiroseovarius sp. KMU-50]MDA5092770.1 RDD family protein [Aliiroseovarius sp. KMU-50]
MSQQEVPETFTKTEDSPGLYKAPDTSASDPDLLAIQAMMQDTTEPNIGVAPAETAQERDILLGEDGASDTQPASPAEEIGPAAPDAQETSVISDEGLQASIESAMSDPEVIAAAECAEMREQGQPEPQKEPEPRKPSRRRFSRLKIKLIPTKEDAGQARRLLARLAVQALSHPRTPRVLAVTILLVVFILWPVFILMLALFTLMVAAIIYLSVGPATVDAFVAKRFYKLRDRDPGRAEELRQRAIRTVRFLDKIVTRLPERWTDGLYLPDFEDGAPKPEKMQSDPFDRLSP